MLQAATCKYVDGQPTTGDPCPPPEFPDHRRRMTYDCDSYAFFNFRLSQIRITAPIVATMISEIRPPEE